jgi:phosphotransferase system IIB component
MPEWLSNPYVLIALGIVFVLLILFIMFKNKKQPKPKKQTQIDTLYMEKLLSALGGKFNLKTVSHEHQRLKVTVKNIKQVEPETLKSLESPAILKGKELTILIKHHTKDVVSYLSEHIGEE